MKTFKTLAVAAAAWLALGATPAAHAALVLPAGTVITGSASGASDRLLGLDTGFADEASSHITRLAAADLEYLTADFAVAVATAPSTSPRVPTSSRSPTTSSPSMTSPCSSAAPTA